MLDQAHDHVCSYPQWLKLKPFWLNILADTFVGLMVAARRWSAVLCTNGEASAGGWRSWRPAGGAHSCRMLEAGRRRMLHHCYIKPPNPTFCSSLGPWTPGGKHGRLGEEKQSIETFYGQARRASSQKKRIWCSKRKGTHNLDDLWRVKHQEIPTKAWQRLSEPGN